MEALLGGSAFLATSALIAWGGSVAATAWEALHPPRRTVGWALARGFACDPAAMGLFARETSLTIRGSTIDTWQIDLRSEGVDVLLLHGYARSRIDSLRRVEPWLPLARSLTLLDLPGHGEARGAGTTLGTHEPALIAQLAEQLHLDRLILVGHSLGAVIAIRSALEPTLKPRVRGVVAIAPYERLATPIGARLDSRGMPRAPLLRPSIALLRCLGVREVPTSESAAQLEVPLGILTGTQDPTSPVSDAMCIAARAPKSIVRTIEGGCHDDLWIVGAAAYSELAQQMARDA